MFRRCSLWILTSAAICGALFADQPGLAESKGPILRDGDRVVFLGDTLLERESTYGWIETALVQSFPDAHFTVRNISWSGDTPRGVSRAMFDGPEKGWERLKDSITELKPTVVFLGYGMAASLQELSDKSGDISFNPDPARYGREPMSAERFKKEMGELMAYIDEKAKGDPAGPVRFVLLEPIHHEVIPGCPDPAAHNALIQHYSKALSDLAKERGAIFATTSRVTSTEPGHPPLTTNGIHLSSSGYHALAEAVAHDCGLRWPGGGSLTGSGEELRQTIVRKNQLFFHRFRPENWTYLFGFRKNEQGRNSVEIPAFDPLIAKEEAEIERLKKSASTAPAAVAAPSHQPSPTPDAAEVLPAFDVAPGFKIELWATNPLLEKPIEMNWDSEGRLWVASSSTYPQVNPEDVAASLASDLAKAPKDAPSAGNDKIIILEDPDHTGKATKSTVFAQGLLIPTGVAPFQDAQHHWGCYVGASTELLELVDTKKTGKADSRKIILSGFGTEDTHHIVHTLRWGPDGRLYFDQSIYIHSHFETPSGMLRMNSGAVLAWNPRTEKVEALYKGFCNPWGHAWDPWGQEFITDGAGAQGLSWGILGGMYFTYENGRKLLQSISPGSYPKFCSLEIIRSPLFPADWQGSAITNDFRAHRIVHFGINDLSKSADPAKAQSGYITKELPDLVRTGDVSFRPIDVKLGPDGALYVADWSNPVINHGEVDFRDPRRDHHRGRIWRIAPADKAPLAWEKLTSKPASDVVQKLITTNNEWELEQARRVLALRPAAEVDAAVAATSGGAAARDSQALREFAWLDVARGRAASHPVLQLAASDSADARALGAKLLRHSTQAPQASAALDRLVKDASPRVRIDAQRTLASIPDAKTGGSRAGAVLDAAIAAPEGDPFYDYSSWLSINDLAVPWMNAVANGEWKVEGHEKQFEVAVNSIDPALAHDVISKVIAARGIPPDGGPWIDLLAKSGGPAELRKLLDALAAGTLTPPAKQHALTSLREAFRIRNVRPDGDLAVIARLLSDPSIPIQADALRLMGAWKLPITLESCRSIPGARSAAPAELQMAAIEALGDFGGDSVVEPLKALLAPAEKPDIRAAALVSLAHVKLGDAVSAANEVLPAMSDPNVLLAAWRGLLQIKGAPGAFAANPPKAVPQPVLAAGLHAARELGKNGEPLAKVLDSLAGSTPDAAKPAPDYKWMIDFVKRDGDPARGESIFRRAQLACLTCHAIGGAGGKVGPELTSLGASAPLDYIIESVLVPNAKVKEGFNAVSLTLKDGTVAAGIQSRETPQEVFLRMVTGQETGVPKANIVSRETIGSIMPAGLVDALPERDRWDLYAFLAQLGKPGPFDASKGSVARYWAIYPGNTPPARVADPSLPAAAQAFTLVDGRLVPELLLPAIPQAPATETSLLAVARFQAPAAGTATLKLDGARDCLLDDKPIQADASGVLKSELTAGVHTVTVKLDAKKPPQALRLQSDDVRFLGN